MAVELKCFILISKIYAGGYVDIFDTDWIAQSEGINWHILVSMIW